MPRAFSSAYKRKVNSSGADESPVILLEIHNDAWLNPIRVCNDNQDLVHLGNTYSAYDYDVVLPSDTEKELERATLRIDNAGEEMTEPLDASRGGVGTTVRFIEVLRSIPDNIEWEATMDLLNISVQWVQIDGELGYEDLLNIPVVTLDFRPDTAPGLY